MTNRREMLRTMGLVAAGVIAADQLEILDRLAPRSLFAGGIPHSDTYRDQYGLEFHLDTHWSGLMIPVGGWEAL